MKALLPLGEISLWKIEVSIGNTAEKVEVDEMVSRYRVEVETEGA